MTTVTAFTPPPNGNFQFSLTLDGSQCTGVISWNIDGNRWYVSVYAADGSLLFSLPLIGSADGTEIQSIDYENGTVTVVTGFPHGYEPLSTVNVTISGCTPDGYNGIVSAFVIDETTFEYLLSPDPGPAVGLGSQSYDVNIAGGYVSSSTLVFRDSSQTFEVSP